MDQVELKEIVRLHGLWVKEGGGARADLSGDDLRGAVLRSANLPHADLRGADLRGSDLSYADLARAGLSYSDLSYSDLRGADLRAASLSDADLTGANLLGANLSGADLAGADLSAANLSGADLSGALGAPPYYSIAWGGHGERGRRLHAVMMDDELWFSCGCFSGLESDLREYIEVGNASRRQSRLRALEIILELHRGA